MSYEGYSQFWCAEGHYWIMDCNELLLMYGEYKENKKQKCPVCGKEEVFENMVNITNGSFDDDGKRIDNFIEPKLKSVHKTQCEYCNKEHICKCSIYEIPKEKKNENIFKNHTK